MRKSKKQQVLVTKNMRKRRHPVLKVLTIVTVLAVIGGICYAIYKYLKPDYLDEFDDDFDDDLEDDFEEEDDFEDEEEASSEDALND